MSIKQKSQKLKNNSITAKSNWHDVLPGAVVVTRQVHFNASHRLHNPRQSEAWNRRTFGLCNSPNFHGHNYVLEVSVAGTPDPETGYVIDLGKLRSILEKNILEQCDHKNLNLDVPFLKGFIPSSENLVRAFWVRIANKLNPHLSKGAKLHRVRLYETPRNYFDYFGPRYSL